MKMLKFLLPLLAAPLLAPAGVTTVFDADFGNSTIYTGTPAAYPAPTSTVTSFAVNSSNGGTVANSTASGLFFNSSSAGTSRVSEVAAVFTTSPVTLSSTGHFIALQATFTGNNILLSGVSNTSATLAAALYNSGGTGLYGDMGNGGLVTGNTTNATGGAQNWVGYNARFGFTSNVNVINVRPAQAGTNNTSQGFTRSGSSSSYATTLTLSSVPSNVSLSNATDYTLLLTLTYDADMVGMNVDYRIYDGVGTGGTLLYTATGTASGSNLITGGTTFDALAFGYRYAGISALANITFSDISVTTNVGPVPEPGEAAAAAGALALLAGLVLRRRKRAGV